MSNPVTHHAVQFTIKLVFVLLCNFSSINNSLSQQKLHEILNANIEAQVGLKANLADRTDLYDCMKGVLNQISEIRTAERAEKLDIPAFFHWLEDQGPYNRYFGFWAIDFTINVKLDRHPKQKIEDSIDVTNKVLVEFIGYLDRNPSQRVFFTDFQIYKGSILPIIDIMEHGSQLKAWLDRCLNEYSDKFVNYDEKLRLYQVRYCSRLLAELFVLTGNWDNCLLSAAETGDMDALLDVYGRFSEKSLRYPVAFYSLNGDRNILVCSGWNAVATWMGIAIATLSQPQNYLDEERFHQYIIIRMNPIIRYEDPGYAGRIISERKDFQPMPFSDWDLSDHLSDMSFELTQIYFFVREK
ncbi:MAG: hypothetical protein ABL958_16855 [Bdellovibrionia bacterium]